MDTSVPCLNEPCDRFYSSNSADSIQLLIPDYTGTVYNWAGFLFELQLIGMRMDLAIRRCSEILENATSSTNGSYVLGTNGIVHISSQWITDSEEITDPVFWNSSWTFNLAPETTVKLRTYKWDAPDRDYLWIRFDDEEPILFSHLFVIIVLC